MVYVMLDNSSTISKNKMKAPFHLNVSTENIYLADFEEGVFQSTDDGIKWRKVHYVSEGIKLMHVFKVKIDGSDGFWATERCYLSDDCTQGNKIKPPEFLRMFTVNLGNALLTRGDINEKIDYSSFSYVYDGNKYIFFSDNTRNTIKVISVNSNYQRNLL